MSNITIGSVSPENVHGYDGAITLRIWFTGCAGSNFQDSLGNIVHCGNGAVGFYKEVAVSLVGTTLTVPSYVLPSTDDSSNLTTLCHAQFYVDGAARDYLFSNWIITNTLGASVSFDALFDYNLVARTAPLTGTAQFLAAVSALITAIAGGFAKASNVLFGIVRTSVAPVSAIDPVVIGANDPSVPGLVLHTSKYASYDAANTALNSLGGGTLVVDTSTPVVASSVSTLITTAVRFEGAGILTGVSKTVNFAGPFSAPTKRIFAAGITATFTGGLNANYWAEWWWSGSGDALAALQAATDAMDTAGGGNLHLLNRTYSISGTWNIGSAVAFHFINIVGTTEIGTVISYTGATNSIALRLNFEKFTHLSRFTISNAVAKGTTEGVRATGTAGGTSTNGLLVSGVNISGFHYAWRSSNGGGSTSSEITFINLTLANNDIGFLNDDFNALNMNFINLIMSDNTIGVDAETAGICVHGGSASGNGTDFKFVNDGINTIIGFRSESIGTHFINFASAGGSNKLTVIGCLAVMATSPNTATAILASGGTIDIRDSSIGGQISIGITTLDLQNCAIIDPNNTFTTIANPSAMGPGFRHTGGAGAVFRSFGNKQYAGDFNTLVAAWPNCSGVTAADDLGAIRAIVTEGNVRGSDAASNTNVFVRGVFFHVTGTNTITGIPTTSLPIGMVIRIVFDSTATLTDGSNLKLAGNLVATANDSITLINDDGTNWVELARSVN